MTTLGLGGPARLFARVQDEGEMLEALELAARDDLRVFVLGGGSNLVVSDEGFDGLVMRIESRGVELGVGDDSSRVRIRAGEPWDGVVERTVAADLAGLECLSGIPGLAGATPIQNVGAYGREIAELITSVRVLDRTTGHITDLDPEACEFGYRDSALKRAPNRWIVLSIDLLLRRGGPPIIRYPELERALDGGSPSLHAVRRSVLALRRKKSMVIDRNDPNHRSAGSFFTNPIVSRDEAQRVIDQALARGVARSPGDVPQFAVDGQSNAVKLAAGWLIERSGIVRGSRHGQVGISSRHALALVHHGGGTTRELLELAAHVRDRVEQTFGIRLVPEPVLLGTELPDQGPNPT